MTTPTRRCGYTMIEILVAVSLMMLIMLGVTQLFSMLGKTLNDTQASLGIAGNLRLAKQRLSEDLKGVTVDLSQEPPVRIGSNSGFFTVIEGMGAPHSNAYLQQNGYVKTSAIAYNADSTDVVDPDSNVVYDNTVGDVDDIISFTARAPVGQKFRGRFGTEPMRDKDNEIDNGNPSAVQVYESDLAEIVWFVRGTTLYRRVLLIVPNAELQVRLDRTSNVGLNHGDSKQSQFRENLKQGIGFYEYFDVSVRRVVDGDTARIVANTLEDLSLRENRFTHGGAAFPSDPRSFPFNPSWSSANYYLRCPTMVETSYRNKDNIDEAYVAGLSFEENLKITRSFVASSGTILPLENGDDRRPCLTYNNDLMTTGIATGTESFSLPGDATKPFIDFWLNPNCWSEQDRLTGNIKVLQENSTRLADDVIMTNVISFDVQVFDPVSGRFLNLGEGGLKGEMDGETFLGTLTDGTQCGVLGTQGHYRLKRLTSGTNNTVWALNLTGNVTRNALPCVYDTWNEYYELPGKQVITDTEDERLVFTRGKNQFDDPAPPSWNPSGTPVSNGVIDDPSEWVAPPPYRTPLRGVKITIRAFDPASKNAAIREMTIVQSFTGR